MQGRGRRVAGGRQRACRGGRRGTSARGEGTPRGDEDGEREGRASSPWRRGGPALQQCRERALPPAEREGASGCWRAALPGRPASPAHRPARRGDRRPRGSGRGWTAGRGRPPTGAAGRRPASLDQAGAQQTRPERLPFGIASLRPASCRHSHSGYRMPVQVQEWPQTRPVCACLAAA